MRSSAVVLILLLTACSGGGSGSDAASSPDATGAPDASSAADAVIVADASPPDASPPDAEPADAGDGSCNPVAQIGCATGSKCTYILDSVEPLLGHTGCAPSGTVAEGDACTSAAVAENGVDDCLDGLFCTGGLCSEICDVLTNSNCDSDEGCVVQNGLFEDVESVGMCQPSCDPLGSPTGCGVDEGCYVHTGNGNTTCAATCQANPACDAGFTKPAAYAGTCSAAGWGTQHCNCECLNCCAADGYGCLLNNDPVSATGSVCAHFCDATFSGGPTCDESSVPGLSCRQVSTFYNNTGNVPPAIGMCVPGDLFPCYGCVNTTEPGCDSCP